MNIYSNLKHSVCCRQLFLTVMTYHQERNVIYIPCVQLEKKSFRVIFCSVSLQISLLHNESHTYVHHKNYIHHVHMRETPSTISHSVSIQIFVLQCKINIDSQQYTQIKNNPSFTCIIGKPTTIYYPHKTSRGETRIACYITSKKAAAKKNNLSRMTERHAQGVACAKDHLEESPTGRQHTGFRKRIAAFLTF